MSTHAYQLRCRECGKTFENQPRSICEDCFSPLEVTYDYDQIKKHISRELIASRKPNIWRYASFCRCRLDFSRPCRWALLRW